VQQAGGGGRPGGVVAAGEWRWLTVAGAVVEVVFGECRSSEVQPSVELLE